MSLIFKPIVTEKSLQDQSAGRYHFRVSVKANKNQLKSDFISIFSLVPVKINILNKKGKIKTDWRRRQKVTKSGYKKAIITLPAGKKIESLTLKEK